MADDWNANVIAEFRANDGVVGGPMQGMPLVLLHTTGARSGAERVNPLVYREFGDDLVVFASKAGAPTNPDWYYNVLANPRVRVEIGADEIEATARLAEGDERDQIWTAQKADFPQFAEYEQGTSRVIPVVILERAS